MSRQAPNTGSTPSPAPGGPAPAGPPAAPSPREYVRILVIAALLGVPVAVAAAAFMSLSHGLTTLVWTTIPDGAGWTAPPWWYVLAVPGIAGLLVAAAVRLPGHGGEPAVAGIALEPLSPVQLQCVARRARVVGVGAGPGPGGAADRPGPDRGSGRRPGTAAGGLGWAAVGGGRGVRGDQHGIRRAAAVGAAVVRAGGPQRQGPLGHAGPGAATGVPGVGDGGVGVHRCRPLAGGRRNGVAAAAPARLSDRPPGRCGLGCAGRGGGRGGGGRRPPHRSGGGRAGGQAPLVVLLCAAGLVVGLLAVGFRAVTGQPVDLVLFSGRPRCPR